MFGHTENNDKINFWGTVIETNYELHNFAN